MFEQTFVDGVGKTHKPWTVVVSFLTQLVGITAAIIIPLLFTDALPKTQLTSFLVAPRPRRHHLPPPAAAAPKIVKVIPRQFDAGKLMQPKAIPKEITMIKEEELPAASGVQGVVGGVPGGVPGGVAGGVIGGIIGSVPTAAPPSSATPEGGSSQAHPTTDPGRRQRASGHGDTRAQAFLPSACQAGSYTRCGPSERSHRQGRNDSGSQGCQRPSATGAGGLGGR